MRRTLKASSLLLALLLAAGGLASCGGNDGGTETGAGTGDDPDGRADGDGSADGGGDDTGVHDGADELAGRTFLSEAVTEEGADRPLVDGTRIRLTFEPGGSIGANAGCNHLGGTLEVEGDRLVVGGMGGTEMGCDPALHDQDEWLAGFLESGPRFTLDGDRLTLESETVVVELVDREVADPDRPLEGTTWEVEGFIEGAGPDGSVSSGPVTDEPATLTFADGQVTFTHPGCNGGSGPAEVSEADGEISLGDLVMTRMACPEPAATTEAAVVAVLQGTISYEIEAGSLTLTHPDGRGLMLAAQGDGS